eukprot:5512305-Amphidinium_carterae.1
MLGLHRNSVELMRFAPLFRAVSEEHTTPAQLSRKPSLRVHENPHLWQDFAKRSRDYLEAFLFGDGDMITEENQAARMFCGWVLFYERFRPV